VKTVLITGASGTVGKPRWYRYSSPSLAQKCGYSSEQIRNNT